MSETILRTKLFMPPLRPSLVPRPRLLEKLQAGANGKLILVSAPAGFGKTTLITHWLQKQSEPTAWYSLDEHDNVPSRFFTYLLTAVQTVYPEYGQTLYKSLQSPNPPEDEDVMSAMVNEFSAEEQPLLLILDDYHVIDNPVIHEALAFLIDYMPPNIHLVLTSREDPPLPLPRWRVRGQLTEIRDTDLRFTAMEAGRFFAETMHLDLADTAVATLEARTEGWVAGLQLAAISIRNAGNADQFINTFTGSERQVADYLLQEVLLQQPEAIQQFLLQTSILERFNADLGNTLLQQKNSHDILDELEQLNLFLIPLDNRRFWYRYHHLFAQLLRYQLERDFEATAVAELHQRAAQWYAAQGLLEEAISHALQIPDYDVAAEFISSMSINNMFAQSGTGLVKQWAEIIPEETIRQYPRVGVLTIGAYMTTGDIVKARHYLKLIADITAVRPEYNFFQSIIIRNEKSDYEKSLKLAQEAYVGLEGREVPIVALSMMQVAVNHLNLGRLDLAEQIITKMRRMLQTAKGDYLNIQLQAIYMQASAARAHVNHFQAEQICLEGINMAKREGQETAPMVGWLVAQLATIYYEWNDLAKAAAYAAEANIWAERTAISDIFIQASMVSADLACTAGDAEAVHKITEAFQQYANKSHMNDVIALSEGLVSLYMLRIGQLETAVRWANASPFSLDDDPPFYKFNLYYILVRIRLDECRALNNTKLLPKCLAMAEKLEQLTVNAGYEIVNISTLTLKALIFDALGNREAALATIKTSLDLSVTGSMMRVYLDLGKPMQDLLTEAVPFHPTYVGRLLQAFAAEETAVAQTTPAPEPPIQLTKREMDVLQAIAAGLSNKEIEDSLFISKNTVRTHIKNLYSKLGVESRTQAIVKAQELEIL